MSTIELRNKLVEFKRLFKYYSYKQPASKNLYISVIDGKYYHGGLTDRFKGIISIYAFCKALNLDYRIVHRHPFSLENYLSPHLYNWQFQEDEFLSYNIFHSKPLILSKEIKGIRLFRSLPHKQFHIYFNRDILEEINVHFNTNYQWRELFYELFQPTPALNTALFENSVPLGKNYIAIVFRFQQLLGDFQEGIFPILPQNQRNVLIEKCLQEIYRIKTFYPGQNFLITSDSIHFLEEAQKIDRCFIIPGQLIHMNYTQNNDFRIHLKPFIDFFLLSKAQKIYSIGTSYMYPTEFPLYAAKLGDIPFERILIT